MKLSRGWSTLLLCWAAAVSLCVLTGEILRIMVPVNQEDAKAVEQRALQAAMQQISNGPATALAPPDVARFDQNAQAGAPSDPVVHVDTAPLRDETPPSISSTYGSGDIRRDNQPASSNQDKRLNLRITRDSERCPKVICYKWHLVTRRLKPPQFTKVELEGLRLAPSLQHDVDNGNIDLLIDAVTQHRTINGHDTLIFIATDLIGVTPHDAPP
jgi:hypothetical protein